MSEESSLGREMGIHGRRWEHIHGGYFSDPEVARPLIDAVEVVIEATKPEVVADLGGGTGFLLGRLSQRCPFLGIRLVNVEISPRQTSECRDEQIEVLPVSLAQVTRADLGVGNDGLLLMARAILHYFGRSGLDPVLGHLRAQQRRGEFFVHQSACFRHSGEAECLNLLYQMMGTEKWYCTMEDLKSRLGEAGWAVEEVRYAPAIGLDSKDLSERYSLSPEQVISIRDVVEETYGQRPGVFTFEDYGFKAWLHSYIFVCEAV